MVGDATEEDRGERRAPAGSGAGDGRRWTTRVPPRSGTSSQIQRAPLDAVSHASSRPGSTSVTVLRVGQTTQPRRLMPRYHWPRRSPPGLSATIRTSSSDRSGIRRTSPRTAQTSSGVASTWASARSSRSAGAPPSERSSALVHDAAHLAGGALDGARGEHLDGDGGSGRRPSRVRPPGPRRRRRPTRSSDVRLSTRTVSSSSRPGRVSTHWKCGDELGRGAGSAPRTGSGTG